MFNVSGLEHFSSYAVCFDLDNSPLFIVQNKFERFSIGDYLVLMRDIALPASVRFNGFCAFLQVFVPQYTATPLLMRESNQNNRSRELIKITFPFFPIRIQRIITKAL